VKLSCVPQAGVWTGEGIAPLVFDIGTIWRWSASLPVRFTLKERSPFTHLNGPQSRCGRCNIAVLLTSKGYSMGVRPFYGRGLHPLFWASSEGHR